MAGIDSKLDELREKSKGLVSSLSEGSKISFASTLLPSGRHDARVSESKARYVKWDLPMAGAQKAQPSMWSETIPMDREFMDTGIWKPEMTRAQDEALMSVNDAEAAGEDPIPRAKAPAFFAWESNKSAGSDKDGSPLWIRAGDGWKNSDGVFYSDKDLVKDILTDLKEDIEDVIDEDAEVDDEYDEVDEEAEEYVTENQLKFKWTESKAQAKPATTFNIPEHSKEDFGFREEIWGAGNWNTEYDSQCLLTMALGESDQEVTQEIMGPVAGVPTDQFTRRKPPVMFSWSRQKPAKVADDEEKDEAPVPEVFSAAPFGVYPSGSSAAPAWKTEADANYTLEALEEVPEPVAVTISTYVPAKDDEEAASSSVKQPKPRSKRFETENSLHFTWPANATPATPASKAAKTQIVYSNEESAAVLPKPPTRTSEDENLLSFGFKSHFVSEMAGRFLKFNLDDCSPASVNTSHKNSSDPYLLHHDFLTLDQVVSDAVAELEEEEEHLGVEETKGGDEDDEDVDGGAEPEQPEEGPSCEPPETEAASVPAPAPAAEEPVASPEPYSTEPLPPPVTVAPDTPVAVKKEKKVAARPSYKATRGQIVNMNPSRKRRQREENAKAARASRAARASTRKNATRDKQAGNPVLRNKRFPGSEGGAKWHTEASSQFQYRFAPPAKPFKFD